MKRNASVTLLSNAAASGGYSTVPGGRYVWASQGTFSGATLTLQAKGPDGSTAMDVAYMTSAGTAVIDVGEATELKVTVSGGPPSGIYSTLKGVN